MDFIENGDIFMFTESSQLKRLISELWFEEEALIASIEGSEREKYLKDCYGARDEISTLLDKRNGFGSKTKHHNDKRMEEIKNVNGDAQEDRSDYLKHVDISMSYVRNWCDNLGWPGLLEYLELETKVFSKKCVKLRKRYVIDYQEEDIQVKPNVQVETKQHYGIPEFAIDIKEYVTYAINVGLQCARNCGARRRWISKIETHIVMLNQVFEDHNDGNLQGMADHLDSYKNCMLEFARNCQKGSIQADSKAYNVLLEKEYEQFSDMATKSKMNELGFPGEFDNLTDSHKLEVWRGIINKSTSALSEPESKSLSISYGLTSHRLPIEYIFGKGDDTIKEFNKPTFHGAQMPNGMMLAKDIKDKKSGLIRLP